MAKLDQILLKTSNLNQKELIDALEGRGVNGSRDRIEQGETVFRFSGEGKLNADGQIVEEPRGLVEMWTVNENENAVQVYVDFGAEIPPWDSTELNDASIQELQDVDFEDGNPDDLTGAAGKVLTWDGAKVVLRDPPGIGEGGAILETLNNVGDVNYGFYAASNKFGPENNDILFYQYNPVKAKYEWAPTHLEIELLDGFSSRSGFLVVDYSNYNGIEFGNPVTTFADTLRVYRSNGAKFVYRSQIATSSGNTARYEHGFYAQSNGQIELSVGPGDDVIIKAAAGRGLGLPGGLRYESILDVPNSVPGPEYFTTLLHVNQAIEASELGVLANVNDTGILQGQVLTWDSLSQQYRPASGVAPDLTQASIEDLQDVSGQGKGRGKPLTWNDTAGSWIPETLMSRDLQWDNNTLGLYSPAYPAGVPGSEDRCEICDENNLGAFTVAANKVYVCLKVRSQIPPVSESDPNDVYDWVAVLLDGYNLTEGYNFQPPDEYSTAYGFKARKDSLAAVAYEGTLGALQNVSTADVFSGAAPVYNPSTASFEMGYPALDLPSYSIGSLGDVNLSGAGVGYGLLWDGSQWNASSLDQQVRLDDLQDVQFGSLGVTNTKLVAAYMMTSSTVLGPTYVYNQDVSTTLAVSTPKDNYFPGSTQAYLWAPSAFNGSYPTQGGTAFFNWRASPPMSVAELLDLYIRWPKDNSWQTIDGDGVIELYFFPTLLLDSRTLFRRVSLLPGTGSYILQLTQAGALRFSVDAPTGSVGFTLKTLDNYISLNNWHHVALVKEGSSNRMYVDGDLVDTASSTTPWTGDDQFVMGRNDLDDNNTLTQQFFRGYMSDLRVTKGRSKYSGATNTLPASIEAEIVDTTPNAGDFLSYDGTKWTNVSGVEGDISNKSVNELNDVDTTSNDPVQGDALVWTGSQWEPGIPGIGANWSLDDMSDVETFYQASVPTVRLSQAEQLIFTEAFDSSEDYGYIRQDRVNTTAFGLRTSWVDCSYTCNTSNPCGSDGTYADSATTYVTATTEGRVNVRAQRMNILNTFYDCSIASFEYHEPTLHYASCPDRGPWNGPQNGTGDIPGEVDDTFIPCWGVIEDHIDEALAYGNISDLSDVSSAPPSLGQALAWNGTTWAPTSSVAADVSNNELNDLGNVSVAGAQTNEVLRFDGAGWVAEAAIAQIDELPDMDIYAVDKSTPLDVRKFRGGDDLYPGSGESDVNEALIPATVHGSGLLDIGTNGGLKGLRWQGSDGGAYLHTLHNNTTRLTSGNWFDTNSATPRESWIEINPYFIRFAGDGNNWGTEGFLMGDNLIIRYENQTRTLSDYGLHDVAPKGLIISYVDQGLANLDLSPNTLEQLGNVDTAGKAPGYALVWDGSVWAATDGVAANISLSSIGELADVTKVGNTDANTNDGSLTFDVGELRTTRPHQTLGGIELTNENNTARIGWSGVWDGAPIMANTANATLASFVRVQELEIQVQSAGGFRYTQDPGLTDSTIPSWAQVKQQIARQASNYTALFFMDGNSFTERNYGWTITNQITTQPNPQYFSKFADQYSYNFRKINQDKLVWTTANGAPFTYNSDTLWSMEMWVYISAADAGDTRLEYIVTEVGPAAGGTANGLTIGLCGDARDKFFFTLQNTSATTGNGGQARPSNTHLTEDGNFDDWNHVYVAHEGSGRHAFYLNGAKVGTILQNSSFNMDGGLSFGGREMSTGADTGGYLTGALDDIRHTIGWLPYPADTNNVAVPVEPLPPGAWKAAFGTLDGLEDVQTSGTYAPTNGQILQWNNVAQAWRPGPANAVAYDVSANSITDLDDVDTTNSTADQDDILRWDVAEGAWRRSKVDGNGGVAPLIARTITPGLVPTASMLKAGELYLNMADKLMYALDDSGSPFYFATGAIDQAGILAAVDTTYDRVVGGTF